MNKMSVERNMKACMSRELPTVFHVIDNASRDLLAIDYILPTFCP